MRSHFHRFAALALLLALLTSPQAHAQPLADRVPADALIYVGWAGAAEAPGYEQSHLKAVLEAWQPLKALDEVVTAALRGEPDEDAQRSWQQFRDVAPILYRHPVAFYFGGVDYGAARQPPRSIRMAIICEAGDDAAKLQQALQPLIDMADAPAGEPLPKLTVKGGTVALHVGDLPPEIATRLGVGSGRDAAGAAAPLSEHGDFTAAMKQIGVSDAAAAVYVNVPGLMDVLDRGIELNESPDEFAQWRAARDTLGLTGLKRIIWAGGFDGADWHTASWIEAPAPRRGIAALLAAPALDDQIVAAVPRTAQWFIAARFDLNKAWQLIRELVAAMDPKAVADLNQQLAQVEQAIGVNLETGVLQPLGDQWLVYGEPSMTLPFGPGAMVLNFTRDGQTLDQSLRKLMAFAGEMLEREQQAPGQPRFAIQQMQSDGATIYSLGFPFISPALAVHEGKLYFALSPQTISMKIAMTKVQVSPITEHPDWKQVMDKLGDHPSQAIAFADLAQTAPVMLQSVTNLAQMVQMQAPAGTNIMKLIPNIATLMPHLAPVGQVGWSDESGIHGRSHSPFPFSSMLSPVGGTMSPAFVGLGVGIALPAVQKARDAARIARSQSQLKQIGLAVHMWADMKGGQQLPHDLTAMVKAELLPPNVLLNPRLGDTDRAPDKLPADQVEQWVRDNSGYVYIGGGRTFREMREGTANTPIAYERLSPQLGAKVGVLFADGHVVMMPLEQAQKVLREAGAQVP